MTALTRHHRASRRFDIGFWSMMGWGVATLTILWGTVVLLSIAGLLVALGQ